MTDTLPAPVRQFALICIFLELAALGGQVAGLGESLRNLLITFGGFWPGLLGAVAPLYPGQAVAMFGTSAVLHGGPLHLAMNMVGLLWLGPIVVARVGERGFWPIAGLSALGAGALYTLLAGSNVPMVGASGVLFGLLGTVAVWIVLDRHARGQSLKPYFGHAVALLGLNVALTVLAGGAVAWQAHLGGFLAGASCALLTWRGARGAV
jgi:membrane associated rhomboid family serine protease